MEVIDVNNNNFVTKYNKILHYVAQLEDSFIDYINILIDNSKRDIKLFENKRPWLDVFYKSLIINSFDGVLHYKLEGGDINIISFSNKLISYKLLCKQITSDNSKGILIHKQEIFKEIWAFMKELVIDYYYAMEIYVHEHNQNVNIHKIYTYKMHDYKMMYILLQYGSYTRMNYPFLLCRYKKVDVEENEIHKFLVIIDNDQ